MHFSLLKSGPLRFLPLFAIGFAVPLLVAKDDGYFNVSYTKSLPSCDRCHSNARTGGAVAVNLTGPQSLQKGKIGNFGIQIVSKVGATKNRAGFTISTTSGLFLAGTNTRTSSSSDQIVHSRDRQRSWNFSFWEKAKTGLLSWYAVGLAVDGNGGKSGDALGFYGPDYKTPGTPFRIFINDTMVTPFGTPCAGSSNFRPILGAASNATRGQNFKVELYNVPGATAALGILGFSNSTMGPIPLPLPLTALGAPGCELNVSMDLVTAAATTGSGAGNGSATWVYPIPSDASLKGLKVYFSTLIVDKGANKFGFTNSNGLMAVVQ